MCRMIILLTLAGLLAGGCYMVEYNYDPYYDSYQGGSYYDSYRGGSYYPARTVTYYSPLEPILDLAILGAVLHGWGHWQPRYHRRAPSYPSFRVRR